VAISRPVLLPFDSPCPESNTPMLFQRFGLSMFEVDWVNDWLLRYSKELTVNGTNRGVNRYVLPTIQHSTRGRQWNATVCAKPFPRRSESVEYEGVALESRHGTDSVGAPKPLMGVVKYLGHERALVPWTVPFTESLPPPYYLPSLLGHFQ
jgi:hypothetical protein